MDFLYILAIFIVVCTVSGSQPPGYIPPTPDNTRPLQIPGPNEDGRQEGVEATCKRVCSSGSQCKIVCTPSPPKRNYLAFSRLQQQAGNSKQRAVFHSPKLKPMHSKFRQMDVLCVLDFEPITGLYSYICPDADDLVLLG